MHAHLDAPRRFACPSCGEQIPMNARRCRYCGLRLSVTLVVANLESEALKHALVKQTLALLGDGAQPSFSALVKRLERLPAALLSDLSPAQAKTLVANLAQPGINLELSHAGLEERAPGGSLFRPEEAPRDNPQPLPTPSSPYAPYAAGVLTGMLLLTALLSGSLAFEFLELRVPRTEVQVHPSPAILPPLSVVRRPSQEQPAHPSETPTLSADGQTELDPSEESTAIAPGQPAAPTTQVPDGTTSYLLEQPIPGPTAPPVQASLAEISFADEPVNYDATEVAAVLLRMEQDYQQANEALKRELGLINRQIRHHQRNGQHSDDPMHKHSVDQDITRLRERVDQALELSLTNTVKYYQDTIEFLERALGKVREPNRVQELSLRLDSFKLQLEAAQKAQRTF
ncbi:MAG: hypothetical protein A2284_08650 [Deltaproteobacteria bacterium RIFOXYA12_FULL_61_11]|nr:MAG: hypothetical protein A2284_08650 [Deltaproteobacteria bacterium RIFOXYA12_FULL_61_11]